MSTSAPGSDMPSKDTDVLRIDRAHATDLSALITLEHAVFNTDRLSARQWRHHLGSPSASAWVARVGDAGLLGAALVFFHAGSDIARLYSLATTAAARGRGVGDALMERAEHDSRERGCRRMRLEVRRDNSGAQRLYARRGFERIGERRGFYEDGHDAVVFEKALATR